MSVGSGWRGDGHYPHIPQNSGWYGVILWATFFSIGNKKNKKIENVMCLTCLHRRGGLRCKSCTQGSSATPWQILWSLKKKLLVNTWSNFQLFQPYMTWIFRHWQHGSIWSSTSKRTSYITVQRKVSKSGFHCKSILQNTQQLQDLSKLNRVRSIWRFTCVDWVPQQLHPEWPQLLTIISRLFLTEVF